MKTCKRLSLSLSRCLYSSLVLNLLYGLVCRQHIDLWSMTIEPILNTLILGHKMEANTTSYIIEKGKQTKSKKFIFTSLTPPHIWSEGPPLHANVHFSLTAGEKRTKHVFTPASCQTCEAAFRGQRVHRICCYCITHFSFCCLAYFLLRCSRPRSRRSSSSRAPLSFASMLWTSSSLWLTSETSS